LFNLFRKKKMVEEIKEYLAKGAIVLDVRTKEEWDEGHTEGAKHIVLTVIPSEIEKIKSWGKPIIAVCRSGGRSGQATQFLANQGIDIINGGPWGNVDEYVSKK
jgi:rhodanese-related sulfurtransferase